MNGQATGPAQAIMSLALYFIVASIAANWKFFDVNFDLQH